MCSNRAQPCVGATVLTNIPVLWLCAQERNRRALELLLQKDQAIQALQDQLAASKAVQEQAEASAAAANARAEALQVSTYLMHARECAVQVMCVHACWCLSLGKADPTPACQQVGQAHSRSHAPSSLLVHEAMLRLVPVCRLL